MQRLAYALAWLIPIGILTLFVYVFTAPTQAPLQTATRVPVLAYHGLGTDPRAEAVYTVPTAQFDAQLSALHSDGYHTISGDDYAQWVQDPSVRLPAKPILITFDDGQVSSSAALPVLRKYGYSASMMVVTGFADGTDPFFSRWSQLRGWDLQFHAGPHGHVDGYYGHVTRALSDIDQGLAEMGSRGIVPELMAVPFDKWTADTAEIFAQRFSVVFVQDSYPKNADEYHMRYRLEVHRDFTVARLLAGLGDSRFEA